MFHSLFTPLFCVQICVMKSHSTEQPGFVFVEKFAIEYWDIVHVSIQSFFSSTGKLCSIIAMNFQ